jgi:hypothetical protein
MNDKVKTQVEHYLYAVAVAAVAIWQTGNHDVKKVVWAAGVAVLAPVLKAAVDKLKKK